MKGRQRHTVYRIKIIIFFLFLLNFILIAGHARAYTITQTNVDDRNDFVLEPARQEVLLDPGVEGKRYVSITSRVKTPTTFKVEIEDITGSEDPDKPVVLLGGDRSPYSLKDYLKPDVSEFTLNFGEKITIPVSIDLPKGASPGGFYAAFIISNAPSKLAASTTDQATQAKTISRIASLFFVRINGPVNQNGQLEDFQIKDSKPVYQRGDLTFQIYFRNSGTVHLVPYGVIDIKNLWGQVVDQIPVNAYFSLPNSLRYREVPWSKGLAFGRYSATVNLHRGYGETIDTKTISFWIIPWKLIIWGFLIIIILVALIYFFVRNFEWKKKK